MSGTKAGGLKAAQTNKTLHGENFYKEIGRKGGLNGNTGGFNSHPDLAVEMGKKMGKLTKRGKRIVSMVGIGENGGYRVVYEDKKTGKRTKVEVIL